MSQHYLSRLFEPSSIAVFGASERPHAVGTTLFANLLSAGFKGELYPINPKHEQVQGARCYSTIQAASQAAMEKTAKGVELAVVATPAPSVPEIIRQCGEAGVQNAVVLSAGFAEAGPAGKRLEHQMVEYARHYGMRVIGPNCLGIMRPTLGLNATFSKNHGLPGDMALVSQSGALITAVLDWAEGRGIGFSSVVSMGEASDLDFGEVLDYLALDPNTHSILMYVEGVRNARRFLSGLRAAARMKPVVVIKSGRHAEGAKAAQSHTAALIGGDNVFDAALERAGVVRALRIEQLFSAAQLLATGNRVHGNRLAIVTNGGGPGVMATDRAIDRKISIADLSAGTIEALNAFLPAHWSHGNPVDVLGDAQGDRYQKTVEVVLKDPNVDGVLVMLTPQAMTEPTGCAEAVIEGVRAVEAEGIKKPVLTSWMGEKLVDEGRERFRAARIPQFNAPEAAVESFAFLANYLHAQHMLMQTPGPLSTHRDPDVAGARLIIEGALAEGRHTLTTLESKAVFAAFHIPCGQTVLAHSANEAMVAAQAMGFPVVMKISSPELTHKSDVGGVRLNLQSAAEVRTVFTEMMDAIRKANPKARIEGITVERMEKRKHGRELLIGVIRDPAFGPVISFGLGGTAVEVIKDSAVALPPLNDDLARQLIARTKAAKLLGPFRGMPAAHEPSLIQVLERVSEMVCELPEIVELDINPLIVDENGAIAVDGRIMVSVRPPAAEPYAHMAIHPYPGHLVRQWQMADGTNITIRPIRPEDAQLTMEFVNALSSETKYLRYHQSFQALSHEMLVRFTQIDYDREMAFVAVTQIEGREIEMGVTRYTVNPDGESSEFAIVVADRWQNRGVGTQLLSTLMHAAKERGLKRMEGAVLNHNQAMRSLGERLGFQVAHSPDDDAVITLNARF